MASKAADAIASLRAGTAGKRCKGCRRPIESKYTHCYQCVVGTKAFSVEAHEFATEHESNDMGAPPLEEDWRSRG